MAPVLYELLGADDRRFSPHVWRSLLALHHKGLKPERRPLPFTDLDEVEFSGHRRVPVLVDGERTVSDSWDIACYLEDAYAKAPSLFGGAMGRAQARFIDHWAATQLHPGLMRLIVLDIHDHLVAEDKEYFRTSRETRLGGPLERVQAEARAQSLVSFRRNLEPLRATLAAQPFLCGEGPAYSDYIVFGAFQWTRCVSDFAVIGDRRIGGGRRRLSRVRPASAHRDNGGKKREFGHVLGGIELGGASAPEPRARHLRHRYGGDRGGSQADQRGPSLDQRQRHHDAEHGGGDRPVAAGRGRGFVRLSGRRLEEEGEYRHRRA